MRNIATNYQIQLDAWNNAFSSYNLLKKALDKIGVNVPSNSSLLSLTNLAVPYIKSNVLPTYEEITITENGVYTPREGIDAFNKVNVNVVSSGKIAITNTDETDVSKYAIAQVEDSNLVAENIKKDVSILGVTGTYEGGDSSGKGTIKALLDYTKSCANMFNGNKTITDLTEYIAYNDTSNVTNTNSMFSSCTSLTTVPLLDTSNVTTMSSMFNNCSKLTTIPLLNTSNVTTMQYMFSDCSSLTTIPQLNTSKVTNMANMFYDCTKLTTIPQLNTSNVTEMNGMFRSCSILTTIPLLDTGNVTAMGNMFYYCSKLTTIPQLNTSNVTNMGYMFYNCSSLTTIPQLDTSKVTNMTNMFYYCSKLTTIPQLNTSNATNSSYMFYGCTSLTTIPQLDTSKVTNMSSMFYNCSKLTDIDMFGMKVSFSLSSSTLLSREVLIKVFNNCQTVTTKQTLTLGTTLLAKLTNEDKAIITGKGWTLA